MYLAWTSWREAKLKSGFSVFLNSLRKTFLNLTTLKRFFSELLKATQDEIRSAYKRDILSIDECKKYENVMTVCPRRYSRDTSGCESFYRCSWQVSIEMYVWFGRPKKSTFDSFGSFGSFGQVHSSPRSLSLAQWPAAAWGLRMGLNSQVLALSKSRAKRYVNRQFVYRRMFKKEYLNQFCRGWSWWKVWRGCSLRSLTEESHKHEQHHSGDFKHSVNVVD